MPYLPISDYGIIGDLETIALVGKNGSIDWHCSPWLDSASVFAAILDDRRGGCWAISPDAEFTCGQSYVGHTNILSTEFKTAAGILEILDFMPIARDGGVPEIIRRVTCKSGRVTVKVLIEPRFDYGRLPASVAQGRNTLTFTGGEPELILWKDSGIIFEGNRASFELSADESTVFSLTGRRAAPSDADKALADTKKYWENWAHRCESTKCPIRGPWHEKAVRSGLVLKLLTHRDSGSIAAAPTTSLPESLEGERNWDYRFAWLRDSIFIVQALIGLGSVREALNFLAWLVELCTAMPPEDLQVLYGLHPDSQVEERTLPYLSGYRGVGPVRIGNAAHHQKQLDIYGELMRGTALFIEQGGKLESRDWAVIENLVDYVTRVWIEPDAGIWEIRGPNRHYVYSKVMCWVAVNEGIKMAERFDPRNSRLPRWRATRTEIHRTVLEKGLNREKNAFTQYFGAGHTDAANLLIPMTGFLPFTDERVFNTVQWVIDELTTEGLVRRYVAPDYLSGQEGAFLACSFWLVDCLVGTGQLDDAVRYFTRIASRGNHLNLFSEECDPVTGELLGNFPQAFTHLALVNSIVLLTNALVARDGEEGLKQIIA